MLKFIFLNHKKLPVPVPIRTLAEAIKWTEDALLTADRIITKVVLDGETRLDVMDGTSLNGVLLSPESKLYVQVDSAKDLSLQTIDALRNLASVLERNLKSVAVALWQYVGNDAPRSLSQSMDDIHLCQDLLDHLIGLIDRDSLGRIEELALSLDRIRCQLKAHIEACDWKSVARVLLNQYEPQILLLSVKLSGLQRHFFDLRSGEAQAKRQ